MHKLPKAHGDLLWECEQSVYSWQSTGTMMNELAERITKYGTLKKHEDLAIQLYEGALIANADPRPILKLATIYASRTVTSGPIYKNDCTYACNLLSKVLYVAKTGPHDDILDGHAVRLQGGVAVMEELYELAKSGNRGAIWLFKKHFDVLRNSNAEDEHGLYKQLHLFLKHRTDEKYAKRFVKSDSFVLELDP